MITEITLEEVHGKIWLCQWGIYEDFSVLAGQEFRQLCKPYDTWEEAITENPHATIVRESRPRPQNYIPRNPPDWFDPLDAGETWSEEDY